MGSAPSMSALRSKADVFQLSWHWPFLSGVSDTFEEKNLAMQASVAYKQPVHTRRATTDGFEFSVTHAIVAWRNAATVPRYERS